MDELTNDPRVFLATQRPDARERQLTIAVALLTLSVFVVLAPFAQVRLPAARAFIPIYETSMVVGDVLTAALLIGQYRIWPARALLVLGGGYLLTASLAVAHMLTFPGAFAPNGLLGANAQSTAWLYVFWHSSFPLAVFTYALLSRQGAVAPHGQGHSSLPIFACAAIAVFLAVALTIIATRGGGWLPQQLSGPPLAPSYTHSHGVVLAATWSLSLLALAALYRRRPHSTLDLWLMVVMGAWLYDIAFSGILNQGRFDLGFYAGRIYGLLASNFVLTILTLENIELYARVVRSLGNTRAEHRMLQLRTAQLNEANASLEERVAARTAALADANRDLLHELTQRRAAEHELKKSREALREVATISASAREQEQRRVARELHDELAQTLAVLKLEIERLAQDALPVDEQTRTMVAGMRTLLDEAATSTRRIAADLRPLVLDDLGLVAAAEWLVQNFRQRQGIDCELIVAPEDLWLDDPHATAVFRIMQESLTNIARHAHASQATISLTRDTDEILLSVSDDGAGFDLSVPRKPNSFGLAGLRERTYLVDGKLNIESSPGHGTTIEVHIPLPAVAGVMDAA